METFSALLALCVGNPPVTGEFPSQRPVTRSVDVFFDLRPNKRLSKQFREAGDLRRHRVHYDVILMRCVKQGVHCTFLKCCHLGENLTIFCQKKTLIHTRNTYYASYSQYYVCYTDHVISNNASAPYITTWYLHMGWVSRRAADCNIKQNFFKSFIFVVSCAL